MRFLMLHGGGTNNQIFELQTAAIRYELGPQHSFEFVEGSLSGPKAPGIDSLVRPEDNFFVYYLPGPESAAQIAKAVDDLQNYLEQDGPFDAILAFSQGCSLAATWCYRAQQSQHMPVKGIVFFSGEPAHSLVGLAQGEARDLDPQSEEGLLRLPTVHVWGAKDVTNPERNKQLYGQCEPGNRGSVILHPGAHELPGPGMDHAVQEIVQSIRRLVGRK